MSTATRTIPARIFVVDDEPNMGRIMVKLLEAEGHEAASFTSPGEALDAIRQTPPDVVVTDLKMPGMTGVELMGQVKQVDESIEVIVMTAYGTIDNAIEAIKVGAYDYVLKPFNTDDLLLTIGKAAERKRLREVNRSLTQELGETGRPPAMIGGSMAMTELRELIKKVAPADSAVLITGESGTGKELVARTIHMLSPRRAGRFVAINCGSIPPSLLESELFGHEKGAFTDAREQRTGKIEWADGGTLFLDELGEMPLNVQTQLLRVLQERVLTRVGGNEEIPVNIRLLAATNRDLGKMLRNGEFRQDLYYRLNVIRIEIPPLRRRQDDIRELAEHFIAKHCQNLGRPPVRLTPSARHAIEIYRWPGNVRELENIIERTLVLLERDEIRPEDLPAEIISPSPGEHTPATPGGFTVNAEYRIAKEHFERIYFAALLSRVRGSVTDAAKQSGMSRRNLYEKMERLNLDINQFKR
ncbi:MAG: sigma-54-dependent Fis family transcriptional regulator [Candidatus Sumerlaeia bacterium]|nr:sigma-54-dependent Fis family transcriptional regulator [Candidatus Sumerlaeia bacterium]